ncbi:cyclase family protein [Rhizobium rhizogenes]|uniref:Cyclase n=1 Tax=Rhizobium rhizogenes TaxID=359 RepID=A0AA92C063_RHIRH|nr:cyclase family protein [Rhizobium rhizogenes]PVE50884.1 cyclase [Rhizobium rhizogenes]PVE62833.1 cyclase [Agrobacterium tumefaciens]PVE71376.1 cyclase [Sphingomonas sp. TPD3009]
MTDASMIAGLASGLFSGKVKVVDLTAPLGPDTPVLYLPPQFGKNTPNVKVHTISAYDQDGPFWAWNWLELGEHTGTHFDAPCHWITGKDNAENTTDTIPPQNFVAPVNVIDRSKEAAENPDYLLTVESIQEWEAEHGAIEPGTWVLLRTDWYKRNGSTETFLNADETGPHSPGPTAEAIEYLLSKGIIGWGQETIGTDAGSAGGMNPPFPAHNLMHKANKYGLASLCHLDQLPPKGAILIAAPLKLVKGTGSPVRALALVV